MSEPKVFDVLVLGAGPAGVAAALFAARRKLSVALIERRARPPAELQIEWLHPGASQVLKQLGVGVGDISAGVLRAVRFVDLRSAQSAAVELDPRVNLVRVNELTARLWAQAASRVTAFARRTDATEIETAEDNVRLTTADGRGFVGRILIAADGVEAGTARRIGVYPEGSGRSAAAAQWSDLGASFAAVGSRPAALEMSLLFDSPVLNDFAYVCGGGGGACVGVLATGGPREALDRFSRAVEYGRAEALLPTGARISDARVCRRALPLGLALEYETHVGKRSLAIGDAGGFVPSLGGAGLHAALESARMAVEVAAGALGAEHPQDALSAFDGLWRAELVDHLRLPSVDLRFLLPLVFSNHRMAERLARAFFGGENM